MLPALWWISLCYWNRLLASCAVLADRLKSSTEDSETIQRPRISGHSSIIFEKVILQPHCIFCDKKGRRKVKEKGVWTTEATTVFECQCLKLQKIKGLRSSYGGSEVLIFCCCCCCCCCFCIWSKFSLQLSQAVSEKPNSLVECKWRKQERAGGPWRVTYDSLYVMHGQRIMKLSDSCEKYVSALEETKHSKPGYKAEKLKKRRKKWHLRADTAILFTEQWVEV